MRFISEFKKFGKEIQQFDRAENISLMDDADNQSDNLLFIQHILEAPVLPQNNRNNRNCLQHAEQIHSAKCAFPSRPQRGEALLEVGDREARLPEETPNDVHLPLDAVEEPPCPQRLLDLTIRVDIRHDLHLHAVLVHMLPRAVGVGVVDHLDFVSGIDRNGKVDELGRVHCREAHAVLTHQPLDGPHHRRSIDLCELRGVNDAPLRGDNLDLRLEAVVLGRLVGPPLGVVDDHHLAVRLNVLREAEPLSRSELEVEGLHGRHVAEREEDPREKQAGHLGSR